MFANVCSIPRMNSDMPCPYLDELNPFRCVKGFFSSIPRFVTYMYHFMYQFCKFMISNPSLFLNITYYLSKYMHIHSCNIYLLMEVLVRTSWDNMDKDFKWHWGNPKVMIGALQTGIEPPIYGMNGMYIIQCEIPILCKVSCPVLCNFHGEKWRIWDSSH